MKEIYKLDRRIGAESPAPLRRWAWVEARPRLALAVIALVATVACLGWMTYRPPTIDSGETGHWWFISENLIHGRGYSVCLPEYFPFCGTGNQATAQREPVPVLLFGGVAALTNESLLVGSLVELAINLGILLGVYTLATRLFGRRAGLLAAFVWALYLPAIELVAQVSGDLPAALALVWGMVLFERATRGRAGLGGWGAAGLCLGLAGLSRSVLLVLPFALVVGLAVWGRVSTPGATGARERLKGAAALLAVFGLTLLPWVARNYVEFHQLIVGSTLTGYNAYRHNAVLPTDNYLGFVNGIVGKQEVDALLARRKDLRGNENEAEMQAVYLQEGLKAIANEPVRFVQLALYRVIPLWTNWGIEEAYGGRDTKSDYINLAEQLLLMVGLVVTLRRNWVKERWRTIWPLVVAVAMVTLAHLPVEAQLRLLIPAMPLVVTLAAGVSDL